MEFLEAVGEFAARDRWVIDGNYTSVGVLDLVWKHADTVVWIDVPKRTAMRQVIWRAVTRATTGEELWNSNRERWRNLFKWRPEENIVRWTWTRFDHVREKYEKRMSDPAWGDLDYIRLKSRSEISDFVASLQGTRG